MADGDGLLFTIPPTAGYVVRYRFAGVTGMWGTFPDLQLAETAWHAADDHFNGLASIYIDGPDGEPVRVPGPSPAPLVCSGPTWIVAYRSFGNTYRYGTYDSARDAREGEREARRILGWGTPLWVQPPGDPVPTESWNKGAAVSVPHLRGMLDTAADLLSMLHDAAVEIGGDHNSRLLIAARIHAERVRQVLDRGLVEDDLAQLSVADLLEGFQEDLAGS
jgi:hypothetical protein